MMHDGSIAEFETAWNIPRDFDGHECSAYLDADDVLNVTLPEVLGKVNGCGCQHGVILLDIEI